MTKKTTNNKAIKGRFTEVNANNTVPVMENPSKATTIQVRNLSNKDNMVSKAMGVAKNREDTTSQENTSMLIHGRVTVMLSKPNMCAKQPRLNHR